MTSMRIALLVESSMYRQGLVAGCAGRGWTLRFALPTVGALRTLANEGVDVVAGPLPLSLEALALRLGLPVVVAGQRRPRVGGWAFFDDVGIGGLAGAHLASGGATTLAALGWARSEYGARRRDGLLATARRLGLPSRHHAYDHGRDEAFRTWIAGLPPGTGIAAANDHLARVACRAAVAIGRQVPADLRVIGADDDQVTCVGEEPHLSSIPLDPRALGRAMADLIARVAAGEQGRPIVLVPPGEVVARTSSAPPMDPVVDAALAVIHARAGDEIGVADIAKAIGAVRRTLERRFRAVTGGTVLEALRGARVARARGLLTATREPIPRIAVACGFRSASQFAVAFRELSGCTPGKWRRGEKRQP